MKKIMAGVLAAAMIMGAGTATTFTGADTVITANAENEEVPSSIKYLTVLGEYISITDFDDSVKELVIPSEIDGLPVKAIGSTAFQNCSTLESIVIPEGVTGIYAATFSGCTSLKNVTLPSTLKEISYDAFKNCISLEEIEIPASLTDIGTAVFANCTNLRTVKIKGIPTIPTRMFENCNLEALYLPKSVTNISENAFSSNVSNGSVQDIYYEGSPEQWNVIGGIKYLKDVNIHYGAENLPVRRTADLNTDGVLDASDASIILAYYAYTMTGGTGTIEEFLAE